MRGPSLSCPISEGSRIHFTNWNGAKNGHPPSSPLPPTSSNPNCHAVGAGRGCYPFSPLCDRMMRALNHAVMNKLANCKVNLMSIISCFGCDIPAPRQRTSHKMDICGGNKMDPEGIIHIMELSGCKLDGAKRESFALGLRFRCRSHISISFHGTNRY